MGKQDLREKISHMAEQAEYLVDIMRWPKPDTLEEKEILVDMDALLEGRDMLSGRLRKVDVSWLPKLSRYRGALTDRKGASPWENRAVPEAQESLWVGRPDLGSWNLQQRWNPAIMGDLLELRGNSRPLLRVTGNRRDTGHSIYADGWWWIANCIYLSIRGVHYSPSHDLWRFGSFRSSIVVWWESGWSIGQNEVNAVHEEILRKGKYEPTKKKS